MEEIDAEDLLTKTCIFCNSIETDEEGAENEVNVLETPNKNYIEVCEHCYKILIENGYEL